MAAAQPAPVISDGCEFSECRRWRYTLWRTWQQQGAQADLFAAGLNQRRDEYLMIVGLNPSTADERVDDPTIRRCINFARKYGFGGLCMTNLFGWRATDPKSMMKWSIMGHDVIGKDNDHWLAESARNAGLIICAWGNDGPFLGRAKAVIALLQQHVRGPLHCFRKTGAGEPEHPLYLPGDLEPIEL